MPKLNHTLLDAVKVNERPTGKKFKSQHPYKVTVMPWLEHLGGKLI